MINIKYFLALTGGGMDLSQDNGATLHYSRVKTRIAEWVMEALQWVVEGLQRVMEALQ